MRTVFIIPDNAVLARTPSPRFHQILNSSDMPDAVSAAILLTIDRLHLGYLGPYGNSWVETPTFNALACQGAVFDRFYTTSTGLDALFGPESPYVATTKSLARSGVKTAFLTDDPEAFARLDDATGGAIFDERCLVTPPDFAFPSVPVDSPEAMGLLETLAEMARLAERRRNDSYFLWCHLGVLGRRWESPFAWRERYRDEEDPVPFDGVKPPFVDFTECLPEEIDFDRFQAISSAYAAEVSALDALLAGCLDALEEGELGPRTLLALAGARGFLMGEHRMAGVPSETTESEKLLWSEIVHVPLFVRTTDLSSAMFRSDALVTPDDLAATLGHWIGESEANESGNSLIPLMLEDIPHPRTAVRIDQDAVVTSTGFLRRRNVGTQNFVEFYVKPDDLWDVNDVASRCDEEVREHLDLLDSPGNQEE